MIHERRRGYMRCALVLLALLVLEAPCLASTLSDDGVALLAFRNAAVKLGSMRVFENWNRKDSHPCSWTGVACSADYRVVGLNITGASLGSCEGGILRRNSWTLQSELDGSACSNGTCVLGGTLAPELGKLTELRTLVLPFNGLEGSIPKEIGKLSNLQVLQLQHNVLSGGIPRELGGLSMLEVLNLEGNLLEDSIPESLAGCQNLVQLNLGRNKLSEAIPPALGNLRRLRQLVLSSNQLNKQVPPQLELTCSTLEHLDLGRNFFTGDVPSWLGNCSKLRVLVLKSNYFRGVIPVELGRLTLLELLDVSMNRLTGRIPESFANCQQLSFLVFTNLPSCVPPFTCFAKTVDKVEFNQFQGPLPATIAALATLEVLWAPRASLTGDIPAVWGSKLKSINLAENSLAGQFPKALGSCQDLRYLDLSSNQLEGQLPAEIPISCMAVFNVSKNRLSGQIRATAGTRCDGYSAPSSEAVSSVICPSLGLYSSSSSSTTTSDSVSAVWVMHDLSSNQFQGPIPAPLVGEADRTLYLLRLSDNQLAGNMSSILNSCGRLGGFSLNVSRNSIEGGLNIVGCSSLVDLDASNNRISGSLPAEIGELQNLTLLELSHNQLQGGIPRELGRLGQLQTLVLANNSLVGSIPDELGEASSLDRLDLSGNSIDGEIPAALGKLNKLEFLILNNNKLSGRIPEALTRISALTAVNLANNNLSGAIPRMGSWADLCDNASFTGNSYLQPCAAVLTPAPADMEQIYNPAAAPPGDSAAAAAAAAAAEADEGGSHKLSLVVIVAITSGAAIAFVLFVLAMLVQCTRQRIPGAQRLQNLRRGFARRGADSSGNRRKEVRAFTSVNFALTYDNVVRATGSFGVDYLIGTGGFGATYKAELTPGLVVAVKRLALGRIQGVQQVQQFDTEIRTLGRIRHPNLVTLIGYHASETEMFLIYNYFPRGNLDSFIRNRCSGDITWQVVHKIALGIAQALAYLHDDCVPRVLHRDIKPSNILLDNSLTAYLADFGLARLLAASETHATTGVAGTFGYVAPEYAMTCRVSDKADVYSYGVVLLELLSGKRALDTAFSEFGDGFNIVAWACWLIGQGRASEVFIVELWETGPQGHLLEILKLAIMCTVDSLVIRPSMKQVVERLKSMTSS